MPILARCRKTRSNHSPRHTMSAWLGVAIVAGLLTAGCGDDNNTGAPAQVDTAQFRLEAFSSSATSSGQLEFQDPGGTRYTLTSLTVAVEEIELDLPDGVSCEDFGGGFSQPLQCDDDGLFGGEDQIRINGPIVFDVLQGTTTPDISNLDIPAVHYLEADLEVDTARAEDDTVPIDSEIMDRTVVALADFEGDNQKRQLKLDFSFKAEAKAGADNRANLALEQGDTLVLRLDVANWLDDIPVTRCLQRGELKARNGVVVLDDESIGDCQDAEADFEENFERSLDVRIERANQ